MTRSLLLLSCLLAVGCLPQVGPLLDDGGDATEVDAGDDGGLLTATCTDTLHNGTESSTDCGGTCPPCALAATCTTALDCASGLCATGHCAPPASTCSNAYAGCTSFTDLTTSAPVVITFSGGGQRYTPRCIRVRFGQTVTFSGDLSSHPLDQGCGPVSNVLRASSGQSFSLTFNQALGTFGYYCTAHGSPSGSGMAGAIEVVR